MLANFTGRRIAVIAGLILSSTTAFGQMMPSGQRAEQDAYRALQNYLHNTLDASAVQSTGTVAQTAFGQPLQMRSNRVISSPTPTPSFGVPGLGESPFGGLANGEVVGSGVPAYTGPQSYGMQPTPAVQGFGTNGNQFEAAPEANANASVVGGAPGEVPSLALAGSQPCLDDMCGDSLLIGPNPMACGAGDCCRCCRFTLGAEYLYWWSKGMRLPELITTSPWGTDPAVAGRTDHPDTTVLYGGDRQDAQGSSGVRVRGSVALDCCGCNKLDFEYFYLGDTDFHYCRETPTDYDILARPYYNPWTGNQDAEFVGYPGQVDGRVEVSGSTSFQGYGVWLRHNLLCCGGGGCGGGGCGGGGGILAGFGRGGGSLAGCGDDCCPPRRAWMPCRIDLLGGYRHLDLDENVTIREYLTVTDPAGSIPFGTELDIYDRFDTKNDFDGFDVGLNWDWCCGKFGVNALTKVAFGQVRRRASIYGFTDITEPMMPTQYYDGGLLALPSNMGSYEDTDFTVIPEVGLNLYYQLSCKLRLNFGYSMVFFRDVLRAGDVIDLDVDPRQLPPPTVFNSTQPNFQDWHDDFWAQGLNAGLELCF